MAERSVCLVGLRVWMCLFALLASIAKDSGRWTKRGSRKKGWRKGVRDGRFKHSNCDTDVGRGRQRMESSRGDMKADGEMPCSRACRMLTTLFHLRLQTLLTFISFDDAGTSRIVDRGRRGAARHGGQAAHVFSPSNLEQASPPGPPNTETSGPHVVARVQQPGSASLFERPESQHAS